MADTKSVSTKGKSGSDKVSVNIFGNIVSFVSNNKVITISIVGLVVVCVYLYQRSRKLNQVQVQDQQGFENQQDPVGPVGPIGPASSYLPQQEQPQEMTPQQRAMLQAMMQRQTPHQEPSDSEYESESESEPEPEKVYNNAVEKAMKERSPSPPPPPKQEVQMTRIPDNISDTNSRIIEVKDPEDADEYALDDIDNIRISEVKHELDSESENSVMTQEVPPDPVVSDDDSPVEYYKRGPKKGQPKPKKTRRRRKK